MPASPEYLIGVVKDDSKAETTELDDPPRLSKIVIRTALFIFRGKSSCNVDVNQIYLLDFVYIGHYEV